MNDIVAKPGGRTLEAAIPSVRLFLAHYTLYVADLDRSIDFYTSALALKKGHRPPFPGPAGAWLYTADNVHVIHLNSDGPVPPAQTAIEDMGWRVSFADRAIDHVAFTVDDFDAAVARVRAHGVSHRIETVPDFGYRQIFFRDPDGVGIELNDFRDTPRIRPSYRSDVSGAANGGA